MQEEKEDKRQKTIQKEAIFFKSCDLLPIFPSSGVKVSKRDTHASVKLKAKEF